MMQFFCSINIIRIYITIYIYLFYNNKQTKPSLNISMAYKMNSKKMPLPEKKAFYPKALPKEILLQFIEALNTVLNIGYNIETPNGLANFYEQLKFRISKICNEDNALNSGIYDLSRLPKFMVDIICDISRDLHYYGREYKLLNSHKIKLFKARKLRADIARANTKARKEQEDAYLFAPGYLQRGVFSRRLAILNQKKTRRLNVSEDINV